MPKGFSAKRSFPARRTSAEVGGANVVGLEVVENPSAVWVGADESGGVEDVGVDFFVKVVGDGDVADVDGGIGEEFVVVRGECFNGGDFAEPFVSDGIEIGDGGKDGGDGAVLEGAPACESRGDFAAHEAASDDGDVDVHKSGK